MRHFKRHYVGKWRVNWECFIINHNYQLFIKVFYDFYQQYHQPE